MQPMQIRPKQKRRPPRTLIVYTHPEFETETETVRATLEAAAAGKIELPVPPTSKHAQPFRLSGTVAYTAATLAEFLGKDLGA